MQNRTLSFLVVIAAVLAACGDDSGRPSFDGGGIGGDGGVTPDSGPGTDGGGGSCIDTDMDGYGEGCALGPDCDDTNGSISPAAGETCNGVDDNCDGAIDEDVVAPGCELTDGVCAGASARCGGADGFLACDGRTTAPTSKRTRRVRRPRQRLRWHDRRGLRVHRWGDASVRLRHRRVRDGHPDVCGCRVGAVRGRGRSDGRGVRRARQRLRRDRRRSRRPRRPRLPVDARRLRREPSHLRRHRGLDRVRGHRELRRRLQATRRSATGSTTTATA